MELRALSLTEHNGFLDKQPAAPGLFLLTREWSELEAAVGSSVDYLGFFTDHLVGIAVCITRNLPLGFVYTYVPFGPWLTSAQDLPEAMELLRQKYNKSIFVRFEPRVSPDFALLTYIKTRDVQPRATLMLSLTPTADELLKAMHPKTRYNIRLAEKKGLTFSVRDATGVNDFYGLLNETATRDVFRAHSRNHYRRIMEKFGQQPLQASVACRILECRRQGILLASNLVVYSHGVATYLHGASSSKYRELMPTYFLHWQSVQQAKAEGLTWYDFWGIATEHNAKSAWAGVTRFKLGFGGKVIDWAGTYDYPTKKIFYSMYSFIRKLRLAL